MIRTLLAITCVCVVAALALPVVAVWWWVIADVPEGTAEAVCVTEFALVIAATVTFYASAALDG